MSRLRRLVCWILFAPPSIWLQARIIGGMASIGCRPSLVVATHRERIIVVKLDRIGDFVLVIPFLRELRRHRSKAWITLVATESVRALAENCPYVNEALFVRRPSSGPRDAWRQWREWLHVSWKHLLPLRASLAIMPRCDVDLYGGYALLAFTNAPRRISYSARVNAVKARRNRGADLLLTDAVGLTGGPHDVERNLALLATLGLTASSNHLELWPSVNGAAAAARHLAAAVDHTLVAVCPVSAEAVKDWPLERFLSVVRHFADRPRTTFLLLAGPEYAGLSDRPDVCALNNLVSLAGRLALDESAALLARCHLVLSVDTGLMHVAAALHRPLVVVSALGHGDDPESHYSPERFGPWGDDAVLVSPHYPATGPRRIDAVTVDQVVAAVAARLPAV